MARKKRTPENDDHKRGSDYAAEQIESNHFRDWVYEQMVEAERMRQADPDSVLPLETQNDALKIAKNMLQQLEWDTKRELDESKEFYEGFTEMLKSTNVREYVADLILEADGMVRPPETRAREAKRTPTSTMYQEAQVFINGRFQVGFTFTPSRGPEAAAREVLSLTRDGDTIEVKQGQEVWTYKVTGKGNAKRLVTVQETREGRLSKRGPRVTQDQINTLARDAGRKGWTYNRWVYSDEMDRLFYSAELAGLDIDLDAAKAAHAGGYSEYLARSGTQESRRGRRPVAPYYSRR
jgi:hypothetical protein